MREMLDGMMGLVVGDALGVPVEFLEREELKASPVKGMREYGTHNQPKGSWSDDSSMALATLDSLNHGYNLLDIASRMYNWHSEGEYTPYGVVFDEGMTCYKAMENFNETKNPYTSGLDGKYDNGNGSLMRILPICIYVCGKNDDEAIGMVHEVSGITHSHPISRIACGIYYFCVKEIMVNPDDGLKRTLLKGIHNAFAFYSEVNEYRPFMSSFARLENIAELEEQDIRSSGYVIYTLEAALWCLFTTESYRACMQQAVNLGYDTDTVAAVAGGLAGLYYGIPGIPEEWLNVIARREWIEDLCLDGRNEVKKENV